MKKTILSIAAALICFLLLQFIGPKQPEYVPVKSLSEIPQEIEAILRNSCFDCHSSETNLRWFNKLTPINYFVYEDILKGREAMDFSKWDSLPAGNVNGQLYYSLNKILEGEMPLPSYTAVHPDAKLSANAIETLKKYLLSRTPRKPVDSSQIKMANQQFSDLVKNKMTVARQSVQPSPNGIAYIPNYRDWKTISITDRFDNGTMRIIYGNAIAVKAIQERQTNPWPDGSIIAKAAWQEQTNADGSISTGPFFQVEFMIKDAKKYATTKGWGWARWRGEDLKPFGGSATFSQDCIACHAPVKDNDYVFTKPLFLNDYLQKSIKK